MSEVRISGSPTPEEEAAVLAAIEKMLRGERDRMRPSPWKMAGRALAARSGILDYRGRLGVNSWTSTGTLPFTGRPYSGRHGRGDAR